MYQNVKVIRISKNENNLINETHLNSFFEEMNHELLIYFDQKDSIDFTCNITCIYNNTHFLNSETINLLNAMSGISNFNLSTLGLKDIQYVNFNNLNKFDTFITRLKDANCETDYNFYDLIKFSARISL